MIIILVLVVIVFLLFGTNFIENFYDIAPIPYRSHPYLIWNRPTRILNTSLYDIRGYPYYRYPYYGYPYVTYPWHSMYVT